MMSVLHRMNGFVIRESNIYHGVTEMNFDLKRKRLFIKELNNISFVGLGKINVGNALSVVLWSISGWTKESVKNIELCVTKGFSLKKTGDKPECAFVYSHSHIDRKDHLIQFNAVESLFQNKLMITASEKKIDKVKFNPYIFLIPIWRMQMRHLECPEYIKKGLCRRICRAAAYAGKMFHMIRCYSSVKKIVFFFDVSEIDSLLVQRCNKKGYITYTLEHGIVNGSYDYIDYKCSQSRYLLLWGEFSKQVAQHYGVAEDRIRLVGNINSLVKDADSQCEDRKVGRLTQFVVCTEGVLTQANWQKNKRMIEYADYLADKYGMTYLLKIHPADKVTRYASCVSQDFCTRICDKRTQLAELLGNVDFLLCGNSTTFGDAIYNGIPAFRYIVPDEEKTDLCKGIVFGKAENLHDLDELVKNMTSNPDAYMAQLEEVRRFLYGEGNPRKLYYHTIMDD